MGASSVITTHGQTRVPGAYSETKVLAAAGSAQGQRALFIMGDAEGGAPGLTTLTSASSARAAFRGGVLLDAALLAFDPSRSSKIAAGPTQVHAYKTNPAVQGTAAFANADGAALELTAADYGEFTNRIGFDLGVGSDQGVAVVVTLDDATESADNVGGGPALAVRYAGEASSVIMTKDATGITLDYTLPIDAQPIPSFANLGGPVNAASDSAYDDYQTATIFGVNAADEPISDVISLGGAVAVVGVVTFKAVTAIRLDSGHAGIITVKSAANDLLATFAATLQTGASGALNVVSTSALDVGVKVQVTGRSAAGNTITQVYELAGLVSVTQPQAFTKVSSARVIGTVSGTVSVRQEADDAVIGTIGAGQNGNFGIDEAHGLYQPLSMVFDGAITTILDAAQADVVGAAFIVIRGRNRAGAVAAERRAVSEVAAATANDWVAITQIEIGFLIAARTLTLTGQAAASAITARKRLKDAAAFISGLPGFDATSHMGAAFEVANLDSASLEIKSVADVSFGADLSAIVEWVNGNSKIITAKAAAGASGAPSPTAAREYLAGGADGVTAMAHWREALLESERVTKAPEFASSRLVMVPLSTDAAVHSLVVGHCTAMDGRHERNAWVGLATGLDKAGIKAAIRQANHRQVSCVAQRRVGFTSDGSEATMDAWAWAVILGALQCGSPVATPLTRAEGNALRSVSDPSWDAISDVEEMLGAGLTVIQGRRVVRSLTSDLGDAGAWAFSEVSTVESLDDSAFGVRNFLNTKVGDKGFDGAASTVRTMAIVELNRQVEAGVIKGFNVSSVTVVNTGDAFDLGYEVEPIEPMNFIQATAYAQRLSIRV